MPDFSSTRLRRCFHSGECNALASALAFTPSIILLYACLALAATLLTAAFYLVLRDLLGDEGWPMLDEARREIGEGLSRDTTASQSMSENVRT